MITTLSLSCRPAGFSQFSGTVSVPHEASAPWCVSPQAARVSLALDDEKLPVGVVVAASRVSRAAETTYQ